MFLNNKNFNENFSVNRVKGRLFLTLVVIAIVACTSDLDNGGAALVGPSKGLTIIPQGPQIIKAGTQTFTAVGGVTPYTYSLSATDIGSIVPTTGVFTALAIAGTATVTVVDKSGATGRTTVNVLPEQLVIDVGSWIFTDTTAKVFTPTLISASGAVRCEVTSNSTSNATATPAVAAAATCTVTPSAVPTSGCEYFTLTITDVMNGDYSSAGLSLCAPSA